MKLISLREIWRLLLLSFRRFYLPEQTIIGAGGIVRLAFSLYFIPLLYVALTLTFSLILNIVFTLLVPLLQEDGPNLLQLTALWREQRMLDFTVAVTLEFGSLYRKILPCCVLGICFGVIGHKMLCSIAEAMIDSFSVTDGRNYALACSMVEFLAETTRRRIITIITAILIGTLAAKLIGTNLLFNWSQHEERVFVATWTIISSQLMYVLFTGLVSYDQLKKLRQEQHSPIRITFVKFWWTRYVARIRYYSIAMLLGFMMYWAARGSGFMNSLSLALECLTYLNLPHFAGFLTSKLAVANVKILRKFKWLRRHPEYTKPALVLATPQLLLLGSCMYHCTGLVLIVFSLAMLWVIVRCIELCEEYYAKSSGPYEWILKDTFKSPLPPHIAAHLEDAMERLHKPQIISLDLAANIEKMVLSMNGQIHNIQRKRRNPSPKLRPFSVVWAALPRMLLLQSRDSHSGNNFTKVRIVIRIFINTLLVILAILLFGVICQQTITPLQELPTHAIVDAGNTQIHVDHIAAHLYASSQADPKFPLTDDYPSLCSSRFEEINLWELSWICLMSYVTIDDVPDMIQFMQLRMNASWKLVDSVGYRTTSPTLERFLHLEHVPSKVSVIAVRGTELTSFIDMLQDVNLFFEVILYHVMSSVVPGTSLLPSSLLTDMVALPSLTDQFSIASRLGGEPYLARDRHYYVGVLNYAQKFLDQNPDRKLLLTGHSLGGTIVHLVAARLHLPSIAFSSPGVLLFRKRYGIEPQDVHARAFTVVHSHDLVAQIGWQGGQVHHMECMSHIPRELCHPMESMVTNLWKSCRSVRERYPNITSVWM